MMKWLKTVRAPKFYRYWYYRQYKFSQSLGDDDAEHSSVIGSAMVFCFHFLAVITIINHFLALGFDVNKYIFLFFYFIH